MRHSSRIKVTTAGSTAGVHVDGEYIGCLVNISPEDARRRSRSTGNDQVPGWLAKYSRFLGFALEDQGGCKMNTPQFESAELGCFKRKGDALRELVKRGPHPELADSIRG